MDRDQQELPFHQAHSETSREAAESIAESVSGLRARVLEAIRLAPATDEELQERLRMAPNTQRPRRVELLKSRLIVEAGKRKTRSGRMATVWRAA